MIPFACTPLGRRFSTECCRSLSCLLPLVKCSSRELPSFSKGVYMCLTNNHSLTTEYKTNWMTLPCNIFYVVSVPLSDNFMYLKGYLHNIRSDYKSFNHTILSFSLPMQPFQPNNKSCPKFQLDKLCHRKR